jgi:amylosucrase
MMRFQAMGQTSDTGERDDIESLRRTIVTSASPARRAMLEARATEWLPRLTRALGNLYGRDAGSMSWLRELLARATALAEARSDALVALDRERERTPDWFLAPGMLAYSAYVDRFAGTLAGVAARIPYLQSIGVTYLHLLPFLACRRGENDGGFAVADFDAIEPALGGMSDLEDLCERLRTAGISLCADFVLNHVADEHPWALAAKAGVPGYRERFHVVEDATLVDRYERHLREVFPQTAPGNFTRVPELDAWVWTTFYPYQWDLDYGKPVVFQEMLLALLRLANRGIEVFRLDSAPFVWKRLGTDCQNLPEVHAVLQALRAAIGLFAPAVLLKAEAIVSTARLPLYLGLGDDRTPQCHLAYHSSLMAASWLSLTERSGRIAARVLAGTPSGAQSVGWLTYVRCHDDIGWNVLRPELADEPDGGQARLRRASRFLCGLEDHSQAQGRPFQTSGADGVHGTNGMLADLVELRDAATGALQPLGLKRLLLLMGVAMTCGAVPMLYMGDELGLAHSGWREADALPGQDGRELHRPRMDEDALARRLVPGTVEQQVFDGIRHLARVRARTPELAGSSPLRVRVCADEAVLVFDRGERFLFIGNFSGRCAAFAPLPDKPAGAQGWLDALTGEPMAGQAVLQAWEQRWLVPYPSPEAQQP